MSEIWLIRHGETEWSVSGAHTGRTDIPLTIRGVEQAKATGRLIHGVTFSRVLSSPLSRARETARLVGWGDAAEIDENLLEWHYGDYEGLTTKQIRESVPDWSVWGGTIPGGETIEQVRERALRVIDRVAPAPEGPQATLDGLHPAVLAAAHSKDAERIALFGHGHMLRILAATWAGLPPQAAQRLPMDTASISRLGFDRGTRVILGWNLAAEFVQPEALNC